MARYVENPAWKADFAARVAKGVTARAELMARDAKTLAAGKSKRWAAAIAAKPARPSGGFLSVRAGIGLTSTREAFPGWFKETGTGQRTRKNGGRTGAMPKDPVFVPVAERWRTIPFTF